MEREHHSADRTVAGPIEPERLPELIDHADVDAGLEPAAKIHGELVRLAMIEVGARA